MIMVAFTVAGCGSVQDDTSSTHEPSPGSDADAVAESGSDVGTEAATETGTDDTAIADVAIDAAPCSPADVATRWATMDADAIRLPNHAATLDLVDASGAILTLDEAEKKLCPSKDLGDLDGDGSRYAAWGASNEVVLHYDPTTRAAKNLELNVGYIGSLTASDPAGHEIVITIGEQITRDAAPFTIPSGWRFDNPDVASAVDDVYRALMNISAPAVAPEAAGTTCVSNKICGFAYFGSDEATWYVKAIGAGVAVDRRNDPEPTPSIPTHVILSVVVP
jgi:hypothetical protein